MTAPPCPLRPAQPLAALLAALCLLLLAGCLVPERYIARVRIEPDGSYKAYAEGTAVHPDAWRALRRVQAEAKSGALKGDALKKAREDALAPLVKELEALRKDKRFEALQSIGDGRVRFSVSGTWTMDRSLLVFNELTTPLAYAVGEDGTLRVRVKDAVHGAGARALGLVTEGNVAVTLAEGVEVLEHNAQRAPGSPLGSYRWSVGPGSTEPPYLKLRLPAAPEPEQSAAPAQATAPTQQKKLAHH